MAIKQENMEKCKDKHCPIHNNFKTRGREFTGTVIEAKTTKTAKIQWQRRYNLTKYERYEKRKTCIKAHNPECINAKKGEIVRITECRPLSKTKHFVIIQKKGQNISFMEREELLKQSKHQETKKETPVNAKETKAEESALNKVQQDTARVQQ